VGVKGIFGLDNYFVWIGGQVVEWLIAFPACMDGSIIGMRNTVRGMRR